MTTQNQNPQNQGNGCLSIIILIVGAISVIVGLGALFAL